jgi:hypothetical protein
VSGALARAGGLFVEWGERAAEPAAPVPPWPPAPVIAVLCAPARARVSAAAVALALARAVGGRCALAAAVGADGPLVPASPAARGAAHRLRERGSSAAASGRLVWISGAAPGGDPPGEVAAASARLGRAAAATGAPAALAVPFARDDSLDRVLAWHDGVIVIAEPGADEAMLAHVVASVTALGRPVACMSPPPRLAARAAALGLHAPPCAVEAVVRLGLHR